MNGGYYGRYASSGHLLYIHKGTLFAARLDVKRLELTGPATPVIDDVASDTLYGFAHMDLSREGRMRYVSRRAVGQTLVWLDSMSRTHPLRNLPAAYAQTVRFSPGGKRLAFSLAEAVTPTFGYMNGSATMLLA